MGSLVGLALIGHLCGHVIAANWGAAGIFQIQVLSGSYTGF